MTNGMPDLDQLLHESQSISLDNELDALLGESVKLREEEAAVKFLREKSKKGGLSKAERDEDEARIRAWETKMEWDTKANIGVFNKTVCTCGSATLTWSHLMHAQVHKEKKVTRTVRATAQVALLPNQIAHQVIAVEACADCAATKGWDLNQAPASVWML